MCKINIKYEKTNVTCFNGLSNFIAFKLTLDQIQNVDWLATDISCSFYIFVRNLDTLAECRNISGSGSITEGISTCELFTPPLALLQKCTQNILYFLVLCLLLIEWQEQIISVVVCFLSEIPASLQKHFLYQSFVHYM